MKRLFCILLSLLCLLAACTTGGPAEDLSLIHISEPTRP